MGNIMMKAPPDYDEEAPPDPLDPESDQEAPHVRPSLYEIIVHGRRDIFSRYPAYKENKQLAYSTS
jgi:hypothetical protein